MSGAFSKRTSRTKSFLTMSCLSPQYMTICRPDVKRQVIGRTKKRWCFKCRGYFVHNKALYSEVLRYDEEGELINGYYEPFLKYECRNCEEEHIEFGS